MIGRILYISALIYAVSAYTPINYNAGDGHVRRETLDNEGNVRGQYSYVDPLGKTILVKYTAGKDGFKVENDPTALDDPSAPAANFAPAPSAPSAATAQYAPLPVYPSQTGVTPSTEPPYPFYRPEAPTANDATQKPHVSSISNFQVHPSGPANHRFLPQGANPQLAAAQGNPQQYNPQLLSPQGNPQQYNPQLLQPQGNPQQYNPQLLPPQGNPQQFNPQFAPPQGYNPQQAPFLRGNPTLIPVGIARIPLNPANQQTGAPPSLPANAAQFLPPNAIPIAIVRAAPAPAPLFTPSPGLEAAASAGQVQQYQEERRMELEAARNQTGGAQPQFSQPPPFNGQFFLSVPQPNPQQQQLSLQHAQQLYQLQQQQASQQQQLIQQQAREKGEQPANQQTGEQRFLGNPEQYAPRVGQGLPLPHVPQPLSLFPQGGPSNQQQPARTKRSLRYSS